MNLAESINLAKQLLYWQKSLTLILSIQYTSH